MNFDKETHTYSENGRTMISVTQLLRKHGLAPDYSAVDPEVLEARSRKGTLIHKEIEEWIKEGKEGFTPHLRSFIDYAPNLEGIESETILTDGFVAGTADLFFLEGGERVVADIKTTSTLHRDAVSWQLSLYAYLDGWRCSKAEAFHFGKEGELTVSEIPLKPKEEVERLIQAEKEGRIYQPSEIVPSWQLEELREAEELVRKTKREAEDAKRRADEVRAAIVSAMEKNGIHRFENESMRIAYIAPSKKRTVDAERLKKELPTVYEEFSKETNTKASVRITLKGE